MGKSHRTLQVKFFVPSNTGCSPSCRCDNDVSFECVMVSAHRCVQKVNQRKKYQETLPTLLHPQWPRLTNCKLPCQQVRPIAILPMLLIVINEIVINEIAEVPLMPSEL